MAEVCNGGRSRLSAMDGMYSVNAGAINGLQCPIGLQ
ncbi:hypothetical protein XMD530_000838 [Marinobacterium sp. xm-d-530]|nr:hypothetical protein [Marinobacterium sp. xm-d-530]